MYLNLDGGRQYVTIIILKQSKYRNKNASYKVHNHHNYIRLQNYIRKGYPSRQVVSYFSASADELLQFLIDIIVLQIKSTLE